VLTEIVDFNSCIISVLPFLFNIAFTSTGSPTIVAQITSPVSITSIYCLIQICTNLDIALLGGKLGAASICWRDMRGMNKVG
jgi:hypothetical protein